MTAGRRAADEARLHADRRGHSLELGEAREIVARVAKFSHRSCAGARRTGVAPPEHDRASERRDPRASVHGMRSFHRELNCWPLFTQGGTSGAKRDRGPERPGDYRVVCSIRSSDSKSAVHPSTALLGPCTWPPLRDACPSPRSVFRGCSFPYRLRGCPAPILPSRIDFVRDMSSMLSSSVSPRTAGPFPVVRGIQSSCRCRLRPHNQDSRSA